MSSDSARIADPTPAAFAGDSMGARLKRWTAATRPKFFPASVLPVIVGSAWGAAVAGRFDSLVFLLAILATVLVHAASNVLNDVGDDEIGTDAANVERIYPYTGGSRFIQAGILEPHQMARLGTVLLLLASLCGLALLLIKGPLILAFGLAGILLGVLYSLGPVRLSATGLGEASVGVAFGIIPVVGSAWLQSDTISSSVFWLAVPVSVWVAAILLINEVPDVAADAANGKRTLPVRVGLNGTALVYLALQFGAVAATAVLSWQGALPILAPLLPLALLALAVRAAAAIRIGVADRPRMTTAIETTLAIHTVGSIWLVGCIAFQAWFAS